MANFIASLCEGLSLWTCPRREDQPLSAGRVFATAHPLWRSGPGEAKPALPALLQAPGFESITETGMVPGTGVGKGHAEAEGG